MTPMKQIRTMDEYFHELRVSSQEIFVESLKKKFENLNFVPSIIFMYVNDGHYTEMQQWLRERASGKWVTEFCEDWFFEKEEDALMFKLAWL
jgi:hypothetical protein